MRCIPFDSPANFPGLWRIWGPWSCPPASSAGFPSSSRLPATSLRPLKNSNKLFKMFLIQETGVLHRALFCSWLMAEGLAEQPWALSPPKQLPKNGKSTMIRKYSQEEAKKETPQTSYLASRLIYSSYGGRGGYFSPPV